MTECSKRRSFSNKKLKVETIFHFSSLSLNFNSIVNAKFELCAFDFRNPRWPDMRGGTVPVQGVVLLLEAKPRTITPLGVPVTAI